MELCRIGLAPSDTTECVIEYTIKRSTDPDGGDWEEIGQWVVFWH